MQPFHLLQLSLEEQTFMNDKLNYKFTIQDACPRSTSALWQTSLNSNKSWRVNKYSPLGRWPKLLNFIKCASEQNLCYLERKPYDYWKSIFSALSPSLNHFHRQRDNSPDLGRKSNSGYLISLPAALVSPYLGVSTPVEWVTFRTHADPELFFPFSSGAHRKRIRHVLGETAVSDVPLHGFTHSLLLFWDVLCEESSYSVSARPFLCENAVWRKW